jgi:hypothetical protein
VKREKKEKEKRKEKKKDVGDASEVQRLHAPYKV